MTTAPRTYFDKRRLRLAALWSLGVGTVAGGLLTLVGGLAVTVVVFALIHGEGHTLIGVLMVLVYVSLLSAPTAGWVAFSFDRLRPAIVLGLWPIVIGATIVVTLIAAPRG